MLQDPSIGQRVRCCFAEGRKRGQVHIISTRGYSRCLGRVCRANCRQLKPLGTTRNELPDRGWFGCLTAAGAHDGWGAGR